MASSPTIKEPTGSASGGVQRWGGPDAVHAAKLLKGTHSTEKIQVVAIDRLTELYAGIKAPVRVASTANINLASATDPSPVDGVTLADGDRILLKDQTAGAENGIYDCVTAIDPTTWTRAVDFAVDADVVSGLCLVVQEGTANGDKIWILTTNGTIVVGTTATTFAEISGGGGGGLSNIVEDITPELGGELDCLSNNIRNLGFIESNAVSPSAFGVIRLGNNERISWRNHNNTGDISLSVDSSDVINTNNAAIALGIGYLAGGGTIASTGKIRLNPNDIVNGSIAWKNNAFTTNLTLHVNSNDRLEYSGELNLANGNNIYWGNDSNSRIAMANGEFQIRVNDAKATKFIVNGIQKLSVGPQLIFADLVDIVLSTTNGTKIATATTQKLGFWNATPVVQPNGTGETIGFVAGVGTGVNDDSTFTGNIGTAAYRVSDVVKALKQVGILAQ